MYRKRVFITQFITRVFITQQLHKQFLPSTFLFQRENIEMYLKACATYGLKEQDLFQVNDLYENKNLYMVVDNLYSLGGMVSFLV